MFAGSEFSARDDFAIFVADNAIPGIDGLWVKIGKLGRQLVPQPHHSRYVGAVFGGAKWATPGHGVQVDFADSEHQEDFRG
jgi:hypothetical protein